MNNKSSICMETLETIIKSFYQLKNYSEKIKILEQTREFKQFYQSKSRLGQIYHKADEKEKLIIASILALGEGPVVFRTLESTEFNPEALDKMLQGLWEVEQFYQMIGGIIGYHYTVLRLLQEGEKRGGSGDEKKRYLKPRGINLAQTGENLNLYIRWGIEHLPKMAEIYPVGGAGDRLDLRDEVTGEPLPAAELNFTGKTLLELLFRDVQAKEYLYYKLINKQLETPIAMMTSEEKGNHQRILDICEKNHWFGRRKESFFFFTQPLVPVITAQGHWAMSGSLELLLKPGGHGVIWKLANDFGVFNWLKERGRSKALVRQINNPVAGTDSGVLAFCGIGCEKGKIFGFASCPRVLHTAQGMVVLIKEEIHNHFQYTISNIEYTDFEKKGFEDIAETSGSPYSKFPANTNILFVDINSLEEIITQNPLPGMLVNFKNNAVYIDPEGTTSEVAAGRLESTMQNISDCIIDTSDHPLNDQELLDAKAFVTYSDRRKTISVTKKSWQASKPLLETPEGCFYEILQNNHELFSENCRLNLSPLCTEQEYVTEGPNLILLFQPALGPLYSVISQKIRRGRLRDGAEMQLDIAEVDIQNIELEGSLLIESENPLSHLSEQGEKIYSELTGKCELINVSVINKGIKRSKRNVYWKNQIERDEKLHIILKGNGEFSAQDIIFEGECTIVVPDGFRWTAVQSGNSVKYIKEKISSPTWFWSYSFTENHDILLTKKKQGDTS